MFPDVGPDLFYNFVAGRLLGPHNVGELFGQFQALAKAPGALSLFRPVGAGPPGRRLVRVGVRLALASLAACCNAMKKGLESPDFRWVKRSALTSASASAAPGLSPSPGAPAPLLAGGAAVLVARPAALLPASPAAARPSSSSFASAHPDLKHKEQQR